jgi:hypothetical protein
MGLKEFIPFFQEEQKKEPAAEEERRSDANVLKDKIRVYERIIDRYRSLIEREESKTIADLKSMIKPNDETIARIRNEITDKMRPYIFDQHFLVAAEAAHKFVREIRTRKVPVDFWLTPKDLIELRGGDPMDKAVFLCSLIVSLENSDSYVIVGVDSGIKVAVAFKFKEEWYLLDPSSRAQIKGEKDSLVEQWFKSDKQIYEFNDKQYNQLKAEEA